MNIKSIFIAALALLISTACSGGAKQEKVMAKDGKALVVFFSHAGDNYAVGNIEVGTRGAHGKEKGREVDKKFERKIATVG